MSALFVDKSLQNESNRFFNILYCEYQNTRRNNSNSLALPNILTIHSRQSIRWMGCKVWKSTYIELRTLQNNNTLKLKYKQLLAIDKFGLFMIFIFYISFLCGV